MDVWYQFEVIASGYPADHKCMFGDWNPMPVGVKPEDLNPPDYDLYEYNPEDRRTADSWCYYATSTADYEKAKAEGYAMSYWKPDCGYVCWVSEGYKIKEVNYGVIPIGDLKPPSGAYALQEALKSGHDRVEVFGFDSIAGVFSTTSTIAFKEHDSPNDIIEDRMDKWINYYKTVTEQYEEIEVIWHTKED
jgi:flavodoxin